MEWATSVQSPSSRPQSPPPPPPSSQQIPTQSDLAMAMTTAEMEAAIDAIPAKKDALRKAFYRLLASSSFPLPFRWDDLDAHISSLHSSISLRFTQLQALEASRSLESAPPARDDHTQHKDDNGERSDGVEGEAMNHCEYDNKNRGSEEEMEEPKKAPPAPGAGEPKPRPDLAGACRKMNASMLLGFVCKSGKGRVAIQHQFLPALRLARDAPSLVLRVVKGILSRDNIKDGNWESCVALLRCLPALAVVPNAATLEEAKAVAKSWKGRIGGSESLMCHRHLVWGFLNFLISYNIVSEFDTGEIIRFIAKIPGYKKNTENMELCKSLGLAERVTDLIDHLIEDEQQLDAVTFVSTFNLADKYPPGSLVKAFVEKAKETAAEILSKKADSLGPLDRAMAKEVSALRLAQKTVEKCGFDSSYRDTVKIEIDKLLHEYAKKKKRFAAASAASASNSQQQQQQNPQEEEQQLLLQKPQEKQRQQQQNPQEKQQQQQQSKKQKKDQQQQQKAQERKQQQQQQKAQEQQQQQQQKQLEKQWQQGLQQNQQQQKSQEKQQQQPEMLPRQAEPQAKQKQQQQHQCNKRPQEKQQHKSNKRPQEKQQHQSNKRPRPSPTTAPVISAPVVPPRFVQNQAQVVSFGHSPYGVIPGVHNYPSQTLPGVQSRPAVPFIRPHQYLGGPAANSGAVYNGLGPYNPYQSHPAYMPRFYPR